MSPQILIADDHADSREILELILRRRGYQVIFATTGSEVLPKIEQSRPDLVILDVRMQGVNGLEVCRRIKSHPDFNAIPILILTAITDPYSTDDAIYVGASTVLRKPCDPDDLLRTIQIYLPSPYPVQP